MSKEGRWMVTCTFLMWPLSRQKFIGVRTGSPGGQKSSITWQTVLWFRSPHLPGSAQGEAHGRTTCQSKCQEYTKLIRRRIDLWTFGSSRTDTSQNMWDYQALMTAFWWGIVTQHCRLNIQRQRERRSQVQGFLGFTARPVQKKKKTLGLEMCLSDRVLA